MTDRFQSRLSEYADGDLLPDEHRLVGRHLDECAECSAILDELRAVRARAGALPERRPAGDLWGGIARRIGELDDAPAVPARPRRAGRRIAMTVPQLAAAALTLASLSAAGAWMTLRGTEGAAAPGAETTDTAAPEAVLAADGAVGGAQRYAEAIAELETALFDSDRPLPPETAERIRRALTTIDRALEDARQALRAAPGDPYLRQHVTDTMRRKAEFLRDAVRLAQS